LTWSPSTNRFRLRNDLYCVEWGVKLYSLTLQIEKAEMLFGHIVLALSLSTSEIVKVCCVYI